MLRYLPQTVHARSKQLPRPRALRKRAFYLKKRDGRRKMRLDSVWISSAVSELIIGISFEYLVAILEKKHGCHSMREGRNLIMELFSNFMIDFYVIVVII